MPSHPAATREGVDEMETKHTKGPWDCGQHDDERRVYYIGSAEGFIGETRGDEESDKANARLIAASPEMLAALHRVANDLEDLAKYHLPERHPDYDIAMSALQMANEAIAKAEGRDQP